MNWTRLPNSLCEYETPRVVTVRYVPLGVLKHIVQILVVVVYITYHLLYSKGFHSFAQVKSSVTTKVLNITINNICNTGTLK